MAPVAAIVVVVPVHIAALPGVAVTVGSGLTVIVLLAVLVQPVDVLVPVTVYVVVTVGDAVSGVPVEALKPEVGVHA